LVYVINVPQAILGSFGADPGEKISAKALQIVAVYFDSRLMNNGRELMQMLALRADPRVISDTRRLAYRNEPILQDS
jgi:hypothetical protein